MKVAKSIFIACLTMAVVAGAFWLGGFNFDRRGEVAVVCYFMCVLFGVWTFGITMMSELK